MQRCRNWFRRRSSAVLEHIHVAERCLMVLHSARFFYKQQLRRVADTQELLFKARWRGCEYPYNAFVIKCTNIHEFFLLLPIYLFAKKTNHKNKHVVHQPIRIEHLTTAIAKWHGFVFFFLKTQVIVVFPPKKL